jgi:hypothetical protein
VDTRVRAPLLSACDAQQSGDVPPRCPCSPVPVSVLIQGCPHELHFDSHFRNLPPVALFIRSTVDRFPTIPQYEPEASSLQYPASACAHFRPWAPDVPYGQALGEAFRLYGWRLRRTDAITLPMQDTQIPQDVPVRPRISTKAVRLYLDAFNAPKPRGRKITPERVSELQAEIDASADPVEKLELIQKRMNAEAKLASYDTDISALEADFVAVAADYSAKRNISYAAWRELGVEPAVLKLAGIPR